MMNRCLALLALLTIALSSRAWAANPTPTPTAAPEADVTVLPSTTLPAWQIVRPCNPEKISLKFGVLIINAGSTASPAVDAPAGISIEDLTMPAWTGTAALPALAAGASVDYALPIPPPGGDAPPQGTHQFNITVNPQHTFPESDFSNNTLTISVDFPKCVNGVVAPR